MRYYSTQRPVTPGTFPKPQNNKVLEIVNYDGKTYHEEIERGCSEGGSALPKLYAAMKKKYTTEGGHD